MDLDEITPGQRDDVVRSHLQAFDDGIAERPKTTFGTRNDDVLAHFDPELRRDDFVRIIRGSAWLK